MNLLTSLCKVKIIQKLLLILKKFYDHLRLFEHIYLSYLNHLPIYKIGFPEYLDLTTY
jgi:hypothetical protein